MEHGSARTAFLALIITTGLVRICGAQTPPINVVLDRLSAYLQDYETSQSRRSGLSTGAIRSCSYS
jgi:hypothetical protein